MRKVVLALACACVLSIPLLAATLADVTLPDTITVNNQTLVLNGLGLRSKMFVKVYVGGLYIEKKASDPAAIIQADAPKRVVMHFIYEPSREQMVDAFKEGFEGNAPGKFQAEVEKWLAAQEALKKGDQIVVTYVPGSGTTRRPPISRTACSARSSRLLSFDRVDRQAAGPKREEDQRLDGGPVLRRLAREGVD
jgi:hypothetical protein